MGAGSVTGPLRTRPPNWKLAPPIEASAQGIVVSGFSKLPEAVALFLFCDWPDGRPPGDEGRSRGGWLQTLDAVAPITDADEKDPRVAILGFTWTGLQVLGLPPDALRSFSAPFREGMYQEDRLRRLGDRIDGVWQPTVIEGGPRWSGNTPVRKAEFVKADDARTAPIGDLIERDERQVPTPTTVHALLLLYEETEERVRTWAASVEAALAPHCVKVVHCLPLSLRLDENDVGREHFGFADGLSHPIPFGEEGAGTVLLDGRPVTPDPWHGVPLGEILLGYTNAHGEKAPGPVVPYDPDDSSLLGRRAAALPPDGAPDGFRNFGLNGSYMVVRELRQDVAAFWRSLEQGAKIIRAHDPTATHVTADWLAERVVGRTVDGHLLCPSGFLPADEYNFPQNAFGFCKSDPHGRGCPPGSHVRRANPRDGSAKDPVTAQTLLDATNNHRILRRGRKYGSTIAQRDQDDGRERGLLFICLNTDICRQFEFIQQHWILNRNFATLFDETDPLVGPKGGFTIREQPLRRIVEVETFVQSAGGEYFFLPSIPALNYLAAL